MSHSWINRTIICSRASSCLYVHGDACKCYQPQAAMPDSLAPSRLWRSYMQVGVEEPCCSWSHAVCLLLVLYLGLMTWCWYPGLTAWTRSCSTWWSYARWGVPIPVPCHSYSWPGLWFLLTYIQYLQLIKYKDSINIFENKESTIISFKFYMMHQIFKCISKLCLFSAEFMQSKWYLSF